jgi:hypothetical protein
MNTKVISIDIPSDILLALNETESELKKASRFHWQCGYTSYKNSQLEKLLNYPDFQGLSLKHSSPKMKSQFQILLSMMLWPTASNSFRTFYSVDLLNSE